MTIEQEQHFEEPTGSFGIDGISLVTYPDRVWGGGWQGRHFRFQLTDFPLVKDVLKGLPNTPVKGPTKLEITFKNDQSADVTLSISQHQGWVEISSTNDMELGFANVDIPALNHVFRNFDKLKKSSQTEHFCKKFGVVDDD